MYTLRIKQYMQNLPKKELKDFIFQNCCHAYCKTIEEFNQILSKYKVTSQTNFAIQNINHRN